MSIFSKYNCSPNVPQMEYVWIDFHFSTDYLRKCSFISNLIPSLVLMFLPNPFPVHLSLFVFSLCMKSPNFIYVLIWNKTWMADPPPPHPLPYFLQTNKYSLRWESPWSASPSPNLPPPRTPGKMFRHPLIIDLIKLHWLGITCPVQVLIFMCLLEAFWL